MAIDYTVDFPCPPKDEFGTEAILERLKGRQRAESIITLFRESGDNRPPSEMGFEFTRRTPEGDEETRIIIVQDLIDGAEALNPYQGYCHQCPVNHAGKPFGCMDFVQYPISAQAENWLLDQLPVPDELLIWMLLRQVIREFKYDGSSVADLRDENSTFFESPEVFTRMLGKFRVNSNQIFEMLFARRPYIMPRQAALILLFLNAIHRDLEADQIQALDPAPENADEIHPFIWTVQPDDDESILQLKAFLLALHTAWKFNVNLLIDA